MNFSDIKQHKIALSLALVFIVFAGCLIIYIAFIHPEEWQSPPQKNLQPTPAEPTTQQSPVASPTERPHYDYCMIDEVHPDYLRVIPDFISPNATIVHLTSDDLEPFPEYQKVMMDESRLTQKWRGGHRSIAAFKDYQRQYSDFRNLACIKSPEPECNPLQAALYEYNGRYFRVGCYPDFGRERPTPPPSPSTW